MFDTGKRFVMIYIFIIIIFTVIVTELYNIQIAKGDEYRVITDDRVNPVISDKAQRGDITDRYGEKLASDSVSYYVYLVNADFSSDELSGLLFELIDICGMEKIADKQNYAENISDTVLYLKEKIENNNVSVLNPYMLAEKISTESVSKIKLNQDRFRGVIISTEYIREYHNNGYASHFIGITGKIGTEEYEKKKGEGYTVNDYTGKQGVEKMLEDYLRGKNGIRRISRDGVLTESILPESGNNVVLTIDMNLQRVLENSLADNISKISEFGADAGAAVVIDVRNGEVLAGASYPSFDCAEFNENYSDYINNPSKPLWNRVVSGTYTPGSTFKPLMAITALEKNAIKPDDKITDAGIYDKYSDYKPRCWIWSENNMTHGDINVSEAIEKSCNYFFYHIADMLGIEAIYEYGKRFGLGEYTGIGLCEEVKGTVASPNSKKEVYKNADEQKWYSADTLLAAIGQSIHSFTPLQIANYIATVANGGERYKVNLIKSIRSSVDGSLIYQSEPEVVERIQMKEETLNAVRTGMKNVADEGSARAIFSEYPIQIGGKTGTAQLGSNVANNALFTAFAPYDNPEIAICVIIEHGVRGANAAYVARDLFDEYFNIDR